MTRAKTAEQAYQQLFLGLADPASLLDLGEAEWDKLLPMARSTRLFSRLAALARSQGLLDRLPLKIVDHMEGSLRFVAHRQQKILWELRQLEKALRETEAQVLVLKGTGYLMAGLRASRGRLFGDVDLLVPRAELDAVEAALRAAGWQSAALSEHDERYYREWMHEIPPMRHPERQIEVDIHHTISPLTARIKVNAAPLLAAAVSVEGHGFQVPAATDLVLHSAVHLFYGGEFEQGLRDLSDLDLLMREFADSHPGFWRELLVRADLLKLRRPLFYALRYTHGLLGTPIPDEVRAQVAPYGPGPVVLGVMDALLKPALLPADPAVPKGWSARARSMLWIRSHLLKMSPGLLLYHVAQKLWKGGK